MQNPPKFANPAALGLAGFALTTFLLSAKNAGLPVGDAFLGFAFFYGGLAQLMAGMWEFPQGNTFGATAFSSYGAFWMGTGFWAMFVNPKNPNDLTYILFAWMIFTLYMTVEALRHASMPVKAVFVLLSITFILLWVGAGFGAPSMIQAGGYAGLLTAAAAWYASWKVAHDAHA